jgi:hypothetical protein
MDFPNALQMLKAGMKMTRTDWEDQEEYVVFENAYFYKHLDGKKFPIVFFGHEVLATDWEIVRTRGDTEAEER